jgi:Mor family transcriptional regulator
MPHMDARIQRQLCKRCLALVQAAEELERVSAMRKAARDQLRALGVDMDYSKPGPRPGDDELDSRLAAMQAAKQKLGIKGAKDKPKLGAKEKPKRKGSPRPTLRGPGSPNWVDVPEVWIKRIMTGEMPPHVAAEKSGINVHVLRDRIQERIGPSEGTRWRAGLGFQRDGRWIGYVPPTAQQQHAAPPPALKPRPVFGPKPKVQDSDCMAIVNHTETVEHCAKRLGVSASAVYTAVKRFKERFGADEPEGEDTPEQTDAKAEPKPMPVTYARGQIPDKELNDLRSGRKSVTQLARKHRISESKVRQQLRDWRARQGAKAVEDRDQLAEQIVQAHNAERSTSNGSVASPTPSNGSAPVLDGATIMQRALGEE